MFLSRDRQIFAKGVAVMIALQGIAWCGLSITGVVVYMAPPTKVQDSILTSESYIDFLSKVIYDEFMVGTRTERVIRPTDFAVFLWIYIFISAIWVGVSVYQFAVIYLNNIRQSIAALALGSTVLVTSIIDLVFISLLSRDLNTCPFYLVPTTDEDTTSVGTPILCQLANGIILTIAARGFVMWIINVALAISLIIIGVKALRTPPLLTYNNTIPRVPEQRKQPSTNDLVFLGDDNVFPPPPPPQQYGNRDRNTMPVALANQNKNMYY